MGMSGKIHYRYTVKKIDRAEKNSAKYRMKKIKKRWRLKWNPAVCSAHVWLTHEKRNLLPSHAGKLNEPSWQMSCLISKERIMCWETELVFHYPAKVTMINIPIDLFFKQVRNLPNPRCHEPKGTNLLKWKFCHYVFNFCQLLNSSWQKHFDSSLQWAVKQCKEHYCQFYRIFSWHLCLLIVSSGFDFLTF